LLPFCVWCNSLIGSNRGAREADWEREHEREIERSVSVFAGTVQLEQINMCQYNFMHRYIWPKQIHMCQTTMKEEWQRRIGVTDILVEDWLANGMHYTSMTSQMMSCIRVSKCQVGFHALLLVL
jgi:hypothetical protein